MPGSVRAARDARTRFVSMTARSDERTIPRWIQDALSPSRCALMPLASDGHVLLWEALIGSFSRGDAPAGWPTRGAAIRDDLGALVPIEIAVARRIRQSGWTAHWIPGIGQRAIRDTWPDDVRYVGQLVKRDDIPRPVRTRIRILRNALRDEGGRNLGWPDIVLWDASGDEVHFVECKRAGEKVTPVQEVWWRKALVTGVLALDDGAFARWQPSVLVTSPSSERPSDR
jgi:hypothetical protein